MGARRLNVLLPVATLKEYWFDWKAYNPETGVYGTGGPLAPASSPQAPDGLAAP